MDREEKGILKENREGKGFPIIPCPCPPYRAPPYIAIYTRMHAPLLPPYMAMFARIHAPLLPPCGLCMCPLLLPNVAHYCSKIWPIAALVHIRYKAWRFLTAFLIVLIFVPLNGACMRAYIGHMGAAMGYAYAHI